MRYWKLAVSAVMLFTVIAAIPDEGGAAPDGTLIITPRESSRYQNADCEKNDTCDLASVEYRLEDFVVYVDGEENYGTRIFSSYTTWTSADLEKYVFVQFIRGCIYETVREAGGKVAAWHDVARQYFNGIRAFNHPVWQIDSIDDNPVYFSMVGKPLHYQYRWNAISDSTDRKTEMVYGLVQPWWPTLYVTDHIGTAFSEANWARNISLEFRTCLYKAVDVPMIVRPEDVNFGPSVNCFQWNSSFIYNFDTVKYEHQEGISSACSSQ